MLDIPFFFLYNCVTIRNKTKMTVTKNEFGQMNMFAKEPSMYMTKEDLERYGIEPYAEKAEKMNGRWAMVGIVAGAITLKVFLGHVHRWFFSKHIHLPKLIFCYSHFSFYYELLHNYIVKKRVCQDPLKILFRFTDRFGLLQVVLG